MTDLPTWAKDRAREWLDGDAWKDLGRDEHGYWGVDGLAALLVEVAHCPIHTPERDVLAEVRRVVESTVGIAHPQREILSRLDPLRVEDLLDGLPPKETRCETCDGSGEVAYGQEGKP